jgi:hypothetical protein
MSGSAVKGAASYVGRRTALRLLPWAWPVYAAIGILRALEHDLSKRERAKLRRLAGKSLGVPMRLSSKERDEAVAILMRVSPFDVARFAAAEISPLPWPKAPGSQRS